MPLLPTKPDINRATLPAVPLVPTRRDLPHRTQASPRQMATANLNVNYDVTIRQQPLHARISALKVSADRRPVDPPIIVQLRVTEPQDNGAGLRGSHLTNPYYFMYAALVSKDDDVEIKCDGGRPSTSGALVSSIRVLKDHPNSDQDAAFFIFPDICVRIEGSWRFKLSLFVIDGESVKLCRTTYSNPFYVYPGKQYPGVQVSTPLTRALAAQGVKLRIRKEIRDKGPTSGVQLKEESTTPEFQQEDDDDDLLDAKSPPKRRRTYPEDELLWSCDSAGSFPDQQPSSYPRPGPSKMSPFEGLPQSRRASEPQSAHRSAWSREGYEPNVMVAMTKPPVSDWEPMRPAHPSPEHTHAAAPSYGSNYPLSIQSQRYPTAWSDSRKDHHHHQQQQQQQQQGLFPPPPAFWPSDPGTARSSRVADPHQAGGTVVGQRTPLWTSRPIY